MYVTITGADHHLGINAFRLNQKLILEKENNNAFDTEAIKVMMDGGATVGYVANSIYTRAIGTASAGFIQHEFSDRIYVEVRFITQNTIIAELIKY